MHAKIGSPLKNHPCAMDKRLKLKLFRVIQFCRSTSAETPSPAIYRLSPVNPKGFDISFPSNNLPAPPSTPEYSFIKRHVSSKAVSVDCGCRSSSCKEDLSSDCSFPRYTRKKEAARCNVVSQAYEPKDRGKIGDASSNGDISPVWVNKNTKKSQRKKKDNKTIASTSSNNSRCFSSEEVESRETDTLISINSRIFSGDSSSELDHSLESTTYRLHKSENGRKNKKITTSIKKIRRMKRHASKNYKGSNMTGWSPELESPAKASVFRRMIPYTMVGKVRESVAVVKKSVDPYEDFKRSMLEMILEKQMYEAKDLEELLQCFLSLNSRKYHGIIVEAFSEIWEALFCDFPVNGQQVGMGA